MNQEPQFDDNISIVTPNSFGNDDNSEMSILNDMDVDNISEITGQNFLSVIPDIQNDNFIRDYLLTRNIVSSNPLVPLDYYRYGYLLSIEMNDSSIHSTNSFSVLSNLPSPNSSITSNISNNTTGEGLTDVSQIVGGKKKKKVRKSKKIKKNKKGTRKKKMKK